MPDDEKIRFEKGYRIITDPTLIEILKNSPSFTPYHDSKDKELYTKSEVIEPKQIEDKK